jgi:hypothetical protein
MACLSPSSLGLKVAPAHHANLGIILVAFKQLGAERKEAGIRQTVVLKDDPALDVLEEPSDGTADC